jgi:hypothetical protein
MVNGQWSMVKDRGLCNSAGLDTVQFLIGQSPFSGPQDSDDNYQERRSEPQSG